MARPKGSKNKPKDEAPPTQEQIDEVLHTDAFKALFHSVLKNRGQAKEFNGMAAKATQQAAEFSGLPAKIITQNAAMENWDAAKRNSYITACLRAWKARGWMPEPDLVDQAEMGAPPPPPQEETNVVRLQQGIKQLEGADAPGTYRVN